MSQRSGRPAQKEFSLLCSQANITCNSSSEDDHGWDFMVEIPLPGTGNLPADKVAAPKPVLVQVKSTKGKSAKTTLKVSNAVKLAKSELPCFVVFFREYQGVKQVYACHFWEELIRRALKRGRQVSAAGRPPHKAKMTIMFSDADDHSSDLIDWIVATATEGAGEYGTAKRTLFDNVGYEGRKYRGVVTLAPLRGVDDLVDHQLGLTDHLPVSHVKLIDSRFDIDAPNPILDETDGRIRFTPNNSPKVEVVLQGSSGDVLSLSGEVRIPVFPKLSAENYRIAIDTWLFKMVLAGDRKMTLHIDDFWERKLTMDRLADLTRFLSWSGDPVALKIVAGEGGPPLNLSATFSSVKHKDKGFFWELSAISGTLLEIQSRSGSPTVALSLFDLANSIQDLSLFNRVLKAEELKLTVSPISVEKREALLSRMLGYLACRSC